MADRRGGERVTVSSRSLSAVEIARTIAAESASAPKDGIYMKLTTGFLLVSVLLASCASQHGPDYAEAWDAAPIPTDLDAVREECGRVRVAMADEQSRAESTQAMMSGPNAPMFRLAIENKERQRLAYLDDRASRLNCRAAFSSAPAPVPVVVPNQDSHMNFDQCFAKCKSLTNRDDSQCFDACK